MSLLVQAQTSKDDSEILECLQLVLDSSKLGLIHESVNVNFANSYTRKSFRVFSHRKRNKKKPLVANERHVPRKLVCLGEWGVC